jgi:hypothetical protein
MSKFIRHPSLFVIWLLLGIVGISFWLFRSPKLNAADKNENLSKMQAQQDPTHEKLRDKIMDEEDPATGFQSPETTETPKAEPAEPSAPEKSPDFSTGESVEDSLKLPPAEPHHPPKMSPAAKPTGYSTKQFKSDPNYGSGTYDPEKEVAIYGGKYKIPNSRPLLEWGRELYGSGPFREASDFLGRKNLIHEQFLMYGDWRTGIAYNDDGKNSFSRLATKLNLDLDLKITATERIHAFFTPLDQDGEFTRWDIGGDFPDRAQLILDPDPDALFFEGDLGRIAEGITDQRNRLDLPFAGGIMPLLFHNGIWMEDAITGFAATIPARNSPALDISNADFTFFAGFDRVDTGAIPNENKAHIFGFNSFIEACQGYWEIGYGYTEGLDEFNDFDYHNLAVSFTRRYFGHLSNSVRVISAMGQDLGGNRPYTANGVLLLVENSLITHKPSTLVPYFNAFVGLDHPQSIARNAGAGGILKNTGINFESDNLTGFPKLEDTANDTYGGAIGIEYLFNLDQQIVLEVAGLDVIGSDNDPDRKAKGAQYGVGARYQLPIANDWLIRFDTIVAARNHEDDLFGVRFEIRNKF